MTRNLVVITILSVALAGAAAAQNDPPYAVGIRSGLISGTMELSRLDPAFDNLAPDGPTGPHMSGFFFLYRVRPGLRVGVETLVANSDKTARTSMNYQAAGPVVELSYGKSWFVSGGMHVGGVIVNAMERQGTSSTGAVAGSYFKGDGYFASPFADAGYRFERVELGLYMKQVRLFGEKDRGGLTDFSSTFRGVRLGFRL